MPYCPSCGEAVDDTAAYCSVCGSSLDDADPHTEARTSFATDAFFGVLGGALALLVGFATTALLAESRENAELARELVSASGPIGVAVSEFLPEWYQVLAWQFLADHQVDVSASVGEEFGNGDFVAEYTQLLLPSASELQVVPPLLLLIAGFLIAWRRSRTGAFDAARAGAMVVLGYLPGILLLLWVATFQVIFPVGDVVLLEITPSLVQGVVIAGVAYPVLFGGLGGLLAFFLDRS